MPTLLHGVQLTAAANNNCRHTARRWTLEFFQCGKSLGTVVVADAKTTEIVACVRVKRILFLLVFFFFDFLRVGRYGFICRCAKIPGIAMASGTSTYRRGGRGGGGGGVDGGGSSGRRRDCHYATVRRSQAHKYSTFSIAKWFRWYRRGYHEKEEEDKLWFHDNLKRLQAAYAAQEQDYDDGATDDVSVTRSVGLAATWSKKFSGSTTTVNSFSYMGGWRDDADNGRTRSTEPNAGLVTFARRRNKRAAPAPPSTVNSTPVNTLKATIPNTPKATATVTPKATPAGTPAATPTATLGAQVKCVGTMRKKNRAPPPPVRAIRFDDEQRPPPQQQQQRKYRSLSQLRGKGPAPKPPVRSSPDCDRLEHQLNRIERHVSSDKSGVNGGRQSLTYEPAAVQFAKMAATNMTELDKRAADICRLNKLRETMYVHDEPANTLPWPTELHYYTSNVTEIGISSASLEVTRASVAPHKSVVVAVLRNAVKSVARNDPTDAKPAVMLDPSVQGSKSEAQGLKPEAYGSKPEAQDLKPEAHALKPKAQVSKPEVRDRDSLLSPKPTPRTSLMIEIEKKVPMPAPQTMSAAETCKTVVTSTAKNDQLLIRHKRLEFFELRQRGKTTFENRNGNVKATKLSLGTQTASSVVLTKPATLDHDCGECVRFLRRLFLRAFLPFLTNVHNFTVDVDTIAGPTVRPKTIADPWHVLRGY